MQAAEAEAWEAELRELGARDEYFFSLGRFVFLAGGPSHSGSSPRERNTLMASARRS